MWIKKLRCQNLVIQSPSSQFRLRLYVNHINSNSQLTSMFSYRLNVHWPWPLIKTMILSWGSWFRRRILAIHQGSWQYPCFPLVRPSGNRGPWCIEITFWSWRKRIGRKSWRLHQIFPNHQGQQCCWRERSQSLLPKMRWNVHGARTQTSRRFQVDQLAKFSSIQHGLASFFSYVQLNLNYLMWYFYSFLLFPVDAEMG